MTPPIHTHINLSGIFKLRMAHVVIGLLCWAHLSFAQSPASAPISAEQIREAVKKQLPSPPDGFTWQVYKNAVLLKPAAWNEHEQSAMSSGIATSTYATSPEDFSATQPFEMGLTVQIISGSQKARGFDANKMVFVYLKPFMDAHKKEDVLMFEQSTKGDFAKTYFRFKDAPAGLTPIIVHKFILANNATDSVHVFTFESPVASWDANWAKYGSPILSRVSVVPAMAPN